ncbi:MAG: Na/Pi cotransporter family protein [Oscillospiraceae bacterium]|nr:Na/Pi cotransporter family protein [Oscillospiraceae bacterium]
MQITNLFSMLGGLALFLYGMNRMSGGLEVMAGDRLKTILEKLTGRRLTGVLVGAGITAVIQSSSATTVMVVGFVNAGIMTLAQAVGVIMGANIGTTVTGVLVALDISLIAPLIAFAGVGVVLFCKKQKWRTAGEIVAGLGILFIGMGMMSGAMKPLAAMPEFTSILTWFRHPAAGILAGMLFTAVVQSSSASIGILQALAMSGVMGLDSAVYILFGQNIGTCVTAMLSAIGTNRSAKRATLVHLMFNVAGTLLFVGVCQWTPFVSWVQGWFPGAPAAQIANVHVIFNVVTTLVLLPAGGWLARAAVWMLPDKKQTGKEQAGLYAKFLEEHAIGGTAVALDTLRREIGRMFLLARTNAETAFEIILNGNTAKLPEVSRREEELDAMNAELTRCIAHVSAFEMSGADSVTLNRLLTVVGNIERIGDHANNMAEYVERMQEKSLKIDGEKVDEVRRLEAVALLAMDQIDFDPAQDHQAGYAQVCACEAESDVLNVRYRENQIENMKKEKSGAELTILYSEMLTDVERMLDHTLNIAQALYEPA